MVKVATALGKELREIGAERSSLGAAALVLARRLDDPSTPAQSVGGIERELRETIAVLKAAAEPDEADRMSGYERRLSVAG